MKGFKVDLEMVNMCLLVVILGLVIVNCIKKENFKDELLEKLRR